MEVEVEAEAEDERGGEQVNMVNSAPPWAPRTSDPWWW